ncbi:DUF58 domain-containing protein [Candidatus Viridilinea mediisalina]|uniref:DUF58 domain-containing protein n=1 Tax=Candidatus Viridilinea mediisalina TaxID=2024553 RepID=A0A2A6RG22_9CHLR|nr:DUF58 domain-containing protein [Candidatus Viridilinea mediisalina]PDW01829.1 DUF58 domain-containing protein [Candidatus Viridilinea mediisalina]
MTTAPPLLTPAFLRQLDRLALLTRRAMAGELQGERRSPRRGASVEFADYRPYTPGDDIRQIDWNLYARMERIFLKLFVAEEELNVHLLLDTSASMDWGEPNKFQYAQQVAAAFGYIALTNLDRVGVTSCTSDGSAAPLTGVRGRRGAVALFSFLQNLSASGSGNLANVCRRYSNTVRTPGPLLLCSDLFDAGWRDALNALAARTFDVTVMHILAPQELKPNLEGDFRLIDLEGGPTVEISADPDLLRRYTQTLHSWQTEIENFCHGRSMNYIQVDTALPIEEFVLGRMRSQNVLK